MRCGRLNAQLFASVDHLFRFPSDSIGIGQGVSIRKNSFEKRTAPNSCDGFPLLPVFLSQTCRFVVPYTGQRRVMSSEDTTDVCQPVLSRIFCRTVFFFIFEKFLSCLFQHIVPFVTFVSGCHTIYLPSSLLETACLRRRLVLSSGTIPPGWSEVAQEVPPLLSPECTKSIIFRPFVG